MRSFTLIILFVMVLSATPANAAPDPLSCTGYSTPRVFLDDQSWWIRTPGKSGNDFGHVHAATCFPLAQTVSGIVPFDVRLTMHENPGAIRKLTIHVEDGNGGIRVLADRFFTPTLTCATTCDFWVHMDADTRVVPLDGYQRFTFRAIVLEPDGNETHTGTGWRAFLSNGNPRKDVPSINRVTGKGWYTGTQYANSSVDGYTSSSKSGTWSIKVICNASKTVTGCLATVDPNFHDGNQGTVLLQRNSQFVGTINIDTNRFSNGPHKLVIRTDVNDPRGSTLSGVLGLPFVVNN